MSEMFIRNLAHRVCAHPEFHRAMETAVTTVLTTVLHEDFAGEKVKFYVSKHPASQRRERDSIIRARFNGSNIQQLSAEFGISPRMVRNIVKIK